jgi:hypothetical protein
MSHDMKMLAGSPLTMPYGQGWAFGLTVDQVTAIYNGENRLAAAVVQAAGGPAAFVLVTDGGRKDPMKWPFEWPSYDEFYAPPVVDKPRVLPTDAGQFVPATGLSVGEKLILAEIVELKAAIERLSQYAMKIQ